MSSRRDNGGVLLYMNFRGVYPFVKDTPVGNHYRKCHSFVSQHVTARVSVNYKLPASWWRYSF